MIEKLQSHYGFTRTPFGRSLAPGMLHRHGAHAEAVARIGWCVAARRCCSPSSTITLGW